VKSIVALLASSNSPMMLVIKEFARALLSHLLMLTMKMTMTMMRFLVVVWLSLLRQSSCRSLIYVLAFLYQPFQFFFNHLFNICIRQNLLSGFYAFSGFLNG
jgi:hypothetical protein